MSRPTHPVTFLTAAFAGALALFPLTRSASADGPPGPPTPPPEAYEACASKASGDACTVVLRDFTVTGTCATDRDGSRQFCRPERPPPPPPDGQPRQ